MFHIAKLQVRRNPFIGLYLSTSDSSLIYSSSIPEKQLNTIFETLKPDKTCKSSISDSYLVGLYAVLNSTGIVLSNLATASEIKRIKHELEINVCTIETRFCAIRNNVLANDKACIVNASMSKSDQRKVQDCLGVEVFPKKLTRLSTVGSVNVVTNLGLLGFNNATDAELEWLGKTLGVHVVRGTTNFGTVTNAYGVVANSKGALIGSITTGVEANAVYQAFDPTH